MGAHFVVAEMNTHHYLFRGVGSDEMQARAALLRAWNASRAALLAQFPQLAASIPDAHAVETHFRIHYLHFEDGAGYRDGERLG